MNGQAGLIVQLIPLTIVCAIMLVPYLRILQRVGRSRWWAVLIFIPGVGIFVLPWVVAFMRWNRDPNASQDVFR